MLASQDNRALGLSLEVRKAEALDVLVPCVQSFVEFLSVADRMRGSVRLNIRPLVGYA